MLRLAARRFNRASWFASKVLQGYANFGIGILDTLGQVTVMREVAEAGELTLEL